VGRIERTWVSISGELEPINYSGPSYIRFPLELAELVIGTYSEPGDWVLDPFCGFGTTVVGAQRLGRYAVGFEKDADRAAFATARAVAPSRVVFADARRMADYELPLFDLLFTSPPYTSFRTFDAEGASHYLEDLGALFGLAKGRLKLGATVVVNVSNIKEETGVRTVAWDAARVLSEIFAFQGELVRCNTGPTEGGLGYDHDYLLVFRST
jgi:DNA modification methylase